MEVNIQANQSSHMVDHPNQSNVMTYINQQQHEQEEADEQIYPPGYRFVPHDHELILNYLKKKVFGLSLPHHRIKDVELYKQNPDDLAAQYQALGNNTWYFFTPRNRKYPNGGRPTRVAGDGYWKKTGGNMNVMHKGKHVGHKSALAFYLGKPKGKKTNWLMYEYEVLDAPERKRDENDTRLDDCVLCKIYKKADTSKSKISEQQNNQPPINVDYGGEPVGITQPDLIHSTKSALKDSYWNLNGPRYDSFINFNDDVGSTLNVDYFFNYINDSDFIVLPPPTSS